MLTSITDFIISLQCTENAPVSPPALYYVRKSHPVTKSGVIVHHAGHPGAGHKY